MLTRQSKHTPMLQTGARGAPDAVRRKTTMPAASGAVAPVSRGGHGVAPPLTWMTMGAGGRTPAWMRMRSGKGQPREASRVAGAQVESRGVSEQFVGQDADVGRGQREGRSAG